MSEKSPAVATPAETAPKKKTPPTGGGRKAGAKSLTLPQKAEAAALWRSGSVTLEDLAKKFKKRPETFSRLFARMGVEKGSAAAAAAREADEAMKSRVASDVDETLRRIAQVKDTHFKMSQSIAVMAFRELQSAKAAELDVGRLKDRMAVYKMLSEVVGNSRKELFEILNVEKHEKNDDLDDLPDLTVRELTQSEVEQLQGAPGDDLDSGEDMMPIDDDEGDEGGEGDA